MTEFTDEEKGADHVERIAANHGRLKSAWERTLEDMTAMAEEREEQGWDALAIMAGDTAPEAPDAGDTDRFGLVHVIPGNYAEDFREAFEAGEFPKYEVYRQEIDGNVFLVTEFLDPETETAIFIAGKYELRYAAGMVEAAEEEGTMYTHVQKLDATHLGTFEHDDHEKLVPHADRIDEWVVEPDVGGDE